MPFKKNNTDAYVVALSLKYKLKKKVVKAILKYGMQNIMKMIEKGEDIRIPGFGHIYVNKFAKIKYRNIKNQNK